MTWSSSASLYYPNLEVFIDTLSIEPTCFGVIVPVGLDFQASLSGLTGLRVINT